MALPAFKQRVCQIRPVAEKSPRASSPRFSGASRARSGYDGGRERGPVAHARHDIPSLDQVFADETAVLTSAAAGLRDALGAERVYAATIGQDGTLRFKASAPVGAGTASPVDPSTVPGMSEAVSMGIVSRMSEAHPPFSGKGELIAIPWVSRGEVLGLGVVIMPEAIEPPTDKVLALVGTKVGAALAALQDCGTLAKRIASLHDAAGTLDAIFAASTDAMKMIDLDGCVLKWNPAAERLYGFPEVEVLGEKMPHLPEDLRLRAVRDIRDVAAAGRVVERSASARRKDGSIVPVVLTLVPYVDGEGSPAGVISLARSVGSRTNVANDDAFNEAVVESVSPLVTALVGYAQLLANTDVVEDVGRRTHAIRALERNAAELAAALEGITFVAEARAGRLELERQDVDVRVVVTDAVSRVEQDNRASHFVVDFDAEVGSVLGDRRRLAQAIEAMLASVVRRSADAQVHVSLGREDDTISIEASTRADESATRETGLVSPGLAFQVARMLTDAHTGTLAGGVGADGRLVYRMRIPLEPEVPITEV